MKLIVLRGGVCVCVCVCVCEREREKEREREREGEREREREHVEMGTNGLPHAGMLRADCAHPGSQLSSPSLPFLGGVAQ